MRGADAAEPGGPDDDPSGAPANRSDADDLAVPDRVPDDLFESLAADDHDHDDEPSRPLPLDDRLWRHPSELATAGLPAAAAPPPPAGRVVHRTTEARPRRRAPEVTMGQRLIAVGLAGGVGALLTAGVLVATGRLSRVETTGPLPMATVTSTIAVRPLLTDAEGMAAVVARVQPGVLSVSASRTGGTTTRGSATIVRLGYAVTALSVVDGASALTLHVDGVPRKADLVGSDPETDLAILAVHGEPVEPPAMGSSSGLRPGDTAVSVMAPPTMESSHSVMVGAVSALDRSMTGGRTVIRGALQLDRPVPSEGAGGALIDTAGSVIGITLPAADATNPFGYAIPIDAVNDVARQLITSGHVSRPWLGIEGGDDPAGVGASVSRVKPSSPAARAGVLPGDVVLAMDDTPIGSMDAMIRLLRSHHAGDTIRLHLMRANKELDLWVTLAEK